MQRLFKDLEDLGCVLELKQSICVIKLRDPGESGQLLTMIVASVYGELYIGWLDNQLRKIGGSEKIGLDYFNNLNVILSEYRRNPNKISNWDISRIEPAYNKLIVIITYTIDMIKKS